MVMVGRNFNFLYKADLSETARIEPGPLGWHTSALTTELQEIIIFYMNTGTTLKCYPA